MTSISERFAALVTQHGDLLDKAAEVTITSAATAWGSAPDGFALILSLITLALLGAFFAASLDARASFTLTADLRRDRDLRVLARVEALKGKRFVLDRALDESRDVGARGAAAAAAREAAAAANQQAQGAEQLAAAIEEIASLSGALSADG